MNKLMASGLGAAGLLAAGAAAAQSYYHSPSYHSRVEISQEVLLNIGAEDGRNFYRALNTSGAEVTMAVTLKTQPAADGADEKSIVKTIALGAYGMSETIYLDAISNDPAWVESWTASPGSLNGAKPADRDASPFYRMAPRYPEECMDKSGARESIDVTYSISVDGRIDQLRVNDVTNGCFAEAAARHVKRWIYAPKIVDGVPAARENVVTKLTFDLRE